MSYDHFNVTAAILDAILKKTHFPCLDFHRLFVCHSWHKILPKSVKKPFVAIILGSNRKLTLLKSLMKDIKSRKLKYFGHIKRHQNIFKSVLEGVAEGRRCRGRQRSVWCDNIKGWTGRSVTACSVAAQNRTEWRSIVANLRTEDGT